MDPTMPPLPSPPSTSSKDELLRQDKRKRERTSRLRRKEKLAKMKSCVLSLERVSFTLRILSDADEIWDEFLNADAKRVRALLRKLEPATRQAQQLAVEKVQLQLLLTEHELARRAIVRLLLPSASDDWEANARRWRALSRLHNRIWTIAQCMKVMNAAVDELDVFVATRDKHSSGISLMGWSDSSCRVANTNLADYCFEKVYDGYDLDHHVDLLWRIYTDVALYESVILNGKARVVLDILQQISPTIYLVRYVKSFIQAPVKIHALYLLFRVETDRSVTQYLKSIPAHDLQRAVNDPAYMWASNSFWIHWQILDPSRERSSAKYRIYAGGTRQAETPAVLSRWRYEVLHTLLRTEAATTGRPLLDFSS